MQKHDMKRHKTISPDLVREAARYAYAGGRFELFKVGRVEGPIYGADINSAYPYAIAQLPSFENGEWRHVTNPTEIMDFGVYHIRMNHRAHALSNKPSPLFHRDKRHDISFPWVVEGWYWSPEAYLVRDDEHTEIVEGWEYIGSTSQPFGWVQEMYDTRREWKAAGNPNEYALKLCMNSLYGKMAQRVGWDEKRKRIPPWHQLEWAGWVTSYTRAMLYTKMYRIPWRDLIAVETDGIYTTYDPGKLGIEESTNLGGWSIDVYDEIIYVQSGLAWLRQGDKWTPKRRGLDPETFQLHHAQEYVKSLTSDRWEPFNGTMKRFIGLKSAIARGGPTRRYHCVWDVLEKEITPGESGKRVHFGMAKSGERGMCSACRQGKTGYEMAHDLTIRSHSRLGEMSAQHSIPWEGKDDAGATWRTYADANDEYYTA